MSCWDMIGKRQKNKMNSLTMIYPGCLSYMIMASTMLLPQLVAVPRRHKDNKLMSGWVRDRVEESNVQFHAHTQLDQYLSNQNQNLVIVINKKQQV